jgi:hypothetical protein
MTADDVLSKLEKMRNERYTAMHLYMSDIAASPDLKQVQKALKLLEMAVFECETLDRLLHCAYMELK